MSTYEPEHGRRLLLRAQTLRLQIERIKDGVEAARLQGLAENLERRAVAASNVPWLGARSRRFPS